MSDSTLTEIVNEILYPIPGSFTFSGSYQKFLRMGTRDKVRVPTFKNYYKDVLSNSLTWYDNPTTSRSKPFRLFMIKVIFDVCKYPSLHDSDLFS